MFKPNSSTSFQFLRYLQTQYDLEIAENELGDKIDQEVMPIAS